MRVLFFGDIVGEPGLRALERELPALLERLRPDFVVANGENLDLTLPEQGRAGIRAAGLDPDLLRVSVGLEPIEEIWAAFAAALPK